MVETENSKVEYDQSGKRCGYAMYHNKHADITFEGTMLDDKWEGLVIATNRSTLRRTEEEFRADEKNQLKGTTYGYKRQYIDRFGVFRQSAIADITNSGSEPRLKREIAVKKISDAFYYKGKFMGS